MRDWTHYHPDEEATLSVEFAVLLVGWLAVFGQGIMAATRIVDSFLN
jgi:hypothetical protein